MTIVRPTRPCKSTEDKACGVNAQCVGNWTGSKDRLELFDNIGYSMLSVFQIVTLENWSQFCSNVGYKDILSF